MDWNDAYANGAYIENAAEYPEHWARQAQAFRDSIGSRAETAISYGPAERQVVDLFHPRDTPDGLAIFVHGGYWMKFGNGFWSHLSTGALAHGWAVAMPQYTLCPDVSISGITREIATVVTLMAERIAGPVVLAGHSAGGHLVTRMVCNDTPLIQPVADRVRHVLSISGVHDLRPLLRTDMNKDLKLDADEARRESPALHEPRTDAALTCWVGADERPEFVRQNALLANVWTGFGVRTTCIEEPGKHHFDVIGSLADADSEMVKCWLAD